MKQRWFKAGIFLGGTRMPGKKHRKFVSMKIPLPSVAVRVPYLRR